MTHRPPLRWLFLLVAGMGVCCTSVWAQPDSLSRGLQAANAAYAQGQYGRAVDLYERLLGRDWESGALYYNLGNAYVRLNQWGEAIRYYEKARRLRPADPRVGHNLEQVRRRAGVYSPVQRPFPGRFQSIVRGWSPRAIFWGGWVLLVGGLVAAVAWGTSVLGQRGRLLLVGGGVLVGLLGIATAFGTAYVQSLDHRAVVVAGEAPLRAAPSPEAVSDTTLPEGALLEVRSRRVQWSKVRLRDGTTGWVSAQALGDI